LNGYTNLVNLGARYTVLIDQIHGGAVSVGKKKNNLDMFFGSKAYEGWLAVAIDVIE
jgi:hypothetical protein